MSKRSLSKLRILQIMSYFFHHCHGLKNNYDLRMLTMSLRIQSPFLSASEKFFGSHVTVRPSVPQGNQCEMGIFYFVWSLDADRRLLWSSWPPGKDNNKAESFFSDFLLMSTLTSITGKELEREIKKKTMVIKKRSR